MQRIRIRNAVGLVEAQDVSFVSVIFDFDADEGDVVGATLEIVVKMVMFWFGDCDVSFWDGGYEWSRELEGFWWC